MALAMLLLLAGCGGTASTNATDSADLETAAIARGLVPDPSDREIVGLYARDTDRVCITKAGLDYRIGAYVDYGDGITCSGSGSLTRAGETLDITLGNAGCSFTARFDGDKLVFPGAVPEPCAKLCARRASYAGTEVARLSESAAEAAAMRDASGRRLCGE